MAEHRTEGRERRTVRSADPSLSDEANELLTHEVREIIGQDEVSVPKDTPRRAEERHGDHARTAAATASIRPVFVVMVCAALVVIGIVALSTGEYLVLVAAGVVLALALFVVAAGALQLTTEIEHVDPAVAARLEAEGVADPDRVVNELVEDFAGAQEARGVPEVISGGHNAQDGRPADQPARAAVQQRTALTPGSAPTGPDGSGSAMAALPWWVAVGMMVASLIGAIAAGGRFWVAPAVVIPLGLGWIALQRWMTREGQGGSATSERATGSSGSSVRRLSPIAAYLAFTVAVLLLTFGWVGELL